MIRIATAITILLLAACSGTASTTGTKDGGGGDGASDDMLLFADGGCPSQVLCGAQGICCDSGEECVEGRCVAPCSSGIRCGDACCEANELCFGDRCVVPTTNCQDSFDCEEGEFCEPTLDQCVAQPAGGASCEVRPATPSFAPTLEWSWTSSPIKSDHLQVINMPVVIDLDGDRIPEVIIVTSAGYETTGTAYLRALDGRSGAEKWAETADVYRDGAGGGPDYTVNPRGTPAAADIDGDGDVEIVAPRRGTGLIAFDHEGRFLWRSMRADGVSPHDGSFNSSTVAIADMDGDGKAEIVCGGAIYDHSGKLTSDASIGRERWGANVETYGPVSIIADVDGDDTTTEQHVVVGNRAIRRDGSLLWDVSATLSDGYPAITDFERDGVPELVVIAQPNVRVQNAVTGALIDELALPGTGRGGPPTIADFDADGEMEIASANGSKYNVFEFDTTTKKLAVKWSRDTQDISSNVTGSSVFDFEGDGAAEVVYNDECYSRVYAGSDGSVLFEVQNSSATIHEYPVLVDVDGDNNTEFVVVANDANHLTGSPACSTTDGSPYVVRHGVFVYGDSRDQWVRTRRIWNQHAYHVTNIAVSGAIPSPETPSYGAQGDRTYRVSSQGAGVFNAPDLQVDLEVSTATCPEAFMLRARVKNAGSLGVLPGVRVDFYEGSDASGPLIGSGATRGALLPGQSEIVEQRFEIGTGVPPFSFYVMVDGGDNASGGGDVIECKEENNAGGAANLRCVTVL